MIQFTRRESAEKGGMMNGGRGLTSGQRKGLAGWLRQRANSQPGLDTALRQNMRRLASNLEKLAANPPPSRGGQRSAPLQRSRKVRWP
jgi:hypothetical protein